MGTVVLRRAAQRARTVHPGGEAYHSFSFGAHYDPDDTGHGLLVACNDEHLHPGGGYPRHTHRGSEVVTVVLSGTLAHVDGTGARALLGPGSVARLDPGAGLEHSEHALAGPARFVQTWLAPAAPGGAAGLEHVALPPGRCDLVPVASAPRRHRGPGVLTLRSDATLLVGRPAPGEVVALPDAPYRHLFLASGVVEVAGVGRLGPGDALRLRADAPGERVALTAVSDAELLLWLTHPRPRSG